MRLEQPVTTFGSYAGAGPMTLLSSAAAGVTVDMPTGGSIENDAVVSAGGTLDGVLAGWPWDSALVNQWRLLTVVNQGSAGVRTMFVDGKPVATSAATVTAISEGSALHVCPGCPVALAEVMIWNTASVTPVQLLSHVSSLRIKWGVASHPPPSTAALASVTLGSSVLKTPNATLPAELPPPKCWVDAAAGDGVFTDTSATVRAEPLQVVRVIRDRGTLGCHVQFPASGAYWGAKGMYTILGSPVVVVRAAGTFTMSPLQGLAGNSGYTIVAVWRSTDGGHPFAVSADATLSATSWKEYINTDTSRVMPAPGFTNNDVVLAVWHKSNTGSLLKWYTGASCWASTDTSVAWLSQATPHITPDLHLAELLVWHNQGGMKPLLSVHTGLSNSQLQSLSVYLNARWGVQIPLTATPSALPAPTVDLKIHQVFSGSPSALPPRTRVPGMRLWFDATNESSMHYGNASGSVAVWEDLSGLGNHALMYSLSRAPTIASNAIGSSNALMFNDQHLELTNMQCMAGITGVTFIVVFRLGNTVPIVVPFANVGTSMNTASVQFGGSLNWLDEAYEIIGSSTRLNLGSHAALGIAANKTHVVCVSGDASDMTRMYINGTQVATWAYGGDYTTLLWAVGREYGKMFGFPNGWLCFEGAIGEIRIYDHRLSPVERQVVFSEMETKWSVSIASQIVVFSGSPSALPALTRVPGMRLWLDATDESSIHYGNASGSVAVWEDWSGLGNHALMYSLSRAPTIASNAIGLSNALMFNDQHMELTNKQCMAGITGSPSSWCSDWGTPVPSSHRSATWVPT